MVGDMYQGNKVKLSVFLLSLSLVLSGCETEEEAAEGHLEKGIELLEKGDFAAAQLELKSAKKGNKSTADTYFYLALLDEKAKHYLSMQDNLKKTLKLKPEHQQARVKLGKLELLMGELDIADEHAEIMLSKNPQDIDALVLKSSILLKQNEQEKAQGFIDQIIALDPINIDGLTLQAMILMKQAKPTEALELIDKAIKADEKNISLHVFKIKIHGQQKDVEAVINDYLILTSLFPGNEQYKITLAKLYTQSKKLDEAEKLLRDLVATRPNQTKPKILLLEFLTVTKSDQVNQQIDTFTKQLSGKPKQLLNFSKWTLAKGNTEKAKDMLNQIVTQEGHTKVGIEANILLAKIAFDTREYATTKKIAKEILSDKPDQLEAKLLQVRLLLIKEEYDLAKTYLGKVIWSHPKSDEALVLLAQYYLVQGDKRQAQTKFKAALDLNSANIQAFIPVYSGLIAQNDNKYARQVLMKALRKNPQQVVLIQKLVELDIQEKKWQEATNAARQLARIPQQRSLAKFYMANILQKQGECDNSMLIYKELIKEFPEQIRVLQGMRACYEILKKRSDFVVFLNEHLQENNDNIAATLVLSDLHVEDNKYKKAIKLLSALIEKKPKAVFLRQRLAKIYLKLEKPNEAILVYQQGLLALPDNIRLSLSLASLYEQQKQYDKAIRVYEKLHVRNPDLQVVNNNLAVLLVEHFATEDNLQRAFQLVDSFATSEQAYYKDTYAWVLLHMGRINEATEIFKKLIIKSPNVPVFRYHLGYAEFKNENNSSAFSQVSQAIDLAKLGENFPELPLAEKLMVKIVDRMQGR